MVDRRQLRDILKIEEMEVMGKIDRVQKPYYDIARVRALALSGMVRFLERPDGKADPANVGMDENEALAIVAKLSLADFDMTVSDSRHPANPPADVYKVKSLLLGRLFVQLYIKLSIRNDGRLLLIISFHK